MYTYQLEITEKSIHKCIRVLGHHHRFRLFIFYLRTKQLQRQGLPSKEVDFRYRGQPQIIVHTGIILHNIIKV